MVDNPEQSPPEQSPSERNAPGQNDVLAAVLAGGAASRMGGGDKCLIEIGGRPLLAHVLDRLRPQAGRIVLSANGDPARFATFGLEVMADAEPGQGPLAGVLAAVACAERTGFAFCLTVPGDTPLLPRDLSRRLRDIIGASGCAVARSGGRRQSAFALWRVAALAQLRDVYGGGLRAVWRAQDALGAVEARFENDEAFRGLNRPDDRTDLAAALARR